MAKRPTVRADLPPGFEARFWAKVEQRGDDECWPWIAAIGKGHGYGVIMVAGSGTICAHIAAWMIAGNERPEAGWRWTLDHSCDHRWCVNPAHLRVLSRGDNVRRGSHPAMIAHRAGQCTRGHPMFGENLYVSPRGQRQCRACSARRRRERSR